MTKRTKLANIVNQFLHPFPLFSSPQSHLFPNIQHITIPHVNNYSIYIFISHWRHLFKQFAQNISMCFFTPSLLLSHINIQFIQLYCNSNHSHSYFISFLSTLPTHIRHFHSIQQWVKSTVPLHVQYVLSFWLILIFILGLNHL